LRAQDPVKVDSKHYKVLFENDQVRVLRIQYAPGDKSPMHQHPDSVAVFLSEQTAKFTFPDGKNEVVTGKTGEAKWIPGGSHEPENIGNKPLEVVLVELKSKVEKK
jgi:quercetin dioxygenase-like cupin family protein